MKNRFKSPRRKIFVVVLLLLWGTLFTWCQAHPIKAIRISQGGKQLVLQTDTSVPGLYSYNLSELNGTDTLNVNTNAQEELIHTLSVPRFSAVNKAPLASEKADAMLKETIFP